MNHRQRVIAAIQHQEPDRLPVDLGGMRFDRHYGDCL